MSEVKSDSEQKKEDWMNSKWRPMMGWMYMVVCFFDMVIFPILWSLIQTVQHQTLVQWNPLTLQGAGLFHIAMGAVLGIAAMGRTQEKIAGSANNAPTTTTPTAAFPSAMPAAPSAPAPAPSAFPAPTPVAAPSSFGSAPSSSFGSGFPGDPPTRNTRNDG